MSFNRIVNSRAKHMNVWKIGTINLAKISGPCRVDPYPKEFLKSPDIPVLDL